MVHMETRDQGGESYRPIEVEVENWTSQSYRITPRVNVCTDCDG